MQDIFKEEKKLYKQGYKCVAGVDEAGRGPLAGPVVASAIVFRFASPPQMRRGLPARNAKHSVAGGRGGVDTLKQHPSFNSSPQLRGGGIEFQNIRDSKKLSEKQREEWYKILTNHPGLAWAAAKVYPRTIDRINIFEATKLAMRRAVEKLDGNIQCHSGHVSESKRRCRNKFGMTSKEIDCLIIDGNFVVWHHGVRPRSATTGSDPVGVPQKSIIKADEKVFLCMAASIIAKVTRDRIMRRMHKKYPQYGFDRHKGYGTKKHLKALKKYGPCEIHRRSFKPIKK